MFVTTLSEEDQTETKDEIILIENPSWEQIEKAIRNLDGEHKTIVTLEASDEIHMAIGGGPEQYIVYATFRDMEFYTLVDLSKPEGREMLVTGGQEGDYPSKQCVDLNTTLSAAKTFAELGALENSVSWEKD
jgi:hypothetical protein